MIAKESHDGERSFASEPNNLLDAALGIRPSTDIVAEENESIAGVELR